MGFNVNNLGRTSTNYNGTNADQVFTYSNDLDTLVEILASGYFDSVSPTLTKGSYIFVESNDENVLVQVTSTGTPVIVACTYPGTTFTSSVESVVAIDETNGPLYGIRDIPLGSLPVSGVITVDVPGPLGIAEINTALPIEVKGSVQVISASAAAGQSVSYILDYIPAGGAGNSIELKALHPGNPLPGDNLRIELTTNFDPINLLKPFGVIKQGFASITYYKN